MRFINWTLGRKNEQDGDGVHSESSAEEDVYKWRQVHTWMIGSTRTGFSLACRVSPAAFAENVGAASRNKKITLRLSPLASATAGATSG